MAGRDALGQKEAPACPRVDTRGGPLSLRLHLRHLELAGRRPRCDAGIVLLVSRRLGEQARRDPGPPDCLPGRRRRPPESCRLVSRRCRGLEHRCDRSCGSRHHRSESARSPKCGTRGLARRRLSQRRDPHSRSRRTSPGHPDQHARPSRRGGGGRPDDRPVHRSQQRSHTGVDRHARHLRRRQLERLVIGVSAASPVLCHLH